MGCSNSKTTSVDDNDGSSSAQDAEKRNLDTNNKTSVIVSDQAFSKRTSHPPPPPPPPPPSISQPSAPTPLQKHPIKDTQASKGTTPAVGKNNNHHPDTNNKRDRNVVFARPLEHAAKLKVYPKSQSEKDFLKSALPKNFVFEDASVDELSTLVDCMEKIHVQNGDRIISQGDSADYFYVIYTGRVDFIVDGKVVGHGESGVSFGELSLLYTTPRAASVQATSSPSVLFRVDQEAFRSVLLQQTVDTTAEKIALLKKVAFLKGLDDEYALTKLAEVMRPVPYAKDATIITKGDTVANHCFILKSGAVRCTGAGDDSAQFEDVELRAAGDYFGERALVTGEPRAASVQALEDSFCFAIDRETFRAVLGDLETVILKSHEKRVLGSIKLLADSKLTSQSLDLLSRYITEETFAPGQCIYKEGEGTIAALYLIKSGSVVVQDDDDIRTIGPGLYFGDEMLKADCGRNKIRVGTEARTTPTYTVYAGDERVICGVLTLGSCRRVFDTRYVGTEQAMSAGLFFDSMVDRSMTLNQFQWHTILGAGTFGQVWLVSRNRRAGDRLAYALKVQSKAEIIQAGQAASVVREKNIMANLQHPFLISLVNTYKDKNFLYMLIQLVQGGELYNLIYSRKEGSALAETDAKFYTACIAEGLGFMHRRGYAYRDLKPENILIDNEGYCIIIDFGFAKYVPAPEKTFTLCGTPLYLAPEVILNRGHNTSADHWSLGVLVYEMLTAETPFYRRGMDQVELYRKIVKSRYVCPWDMSDDIVNIIGGFLTRDPAQRLGSLADGEDDIPKHEFFASIDFNELRQKSLKAPYIPRIKDPLDASNFDDWGAMDDKRKQVYPALNATQEAVFDEF